MRGSASGVEGSARQGWVVDSAPTDLQNGGPTNGGVNNTPLPNKLLSLASPSPRYLA